MSTTPRKPGTGTDTWDDEHDTTLACGIIANAWASRKQLYALDGIVGCVDNHGNDRVARRLTQMLEQFAKTHKVPKGFVKSLKTTTKGKRAAPSSASPSAGASQPPKKRRRGIKAEATDESDTAAVTESDEAEFTE